MAETNRTVKSGTKGNSRSSASSAKKPVKKSAKKPAAKTNRKPAAKLTQEEIRQKNQVRAVILFACAVFLACVVIISGDNLWNWLHNAMLGVFGSWAILWPLLIAYTAVITALERPKASVAGKIWLTALVVVLFCAAGFIFGGHSVPESLGFSGYVSYLFTQHANIFGGVTGGLTGFPLITAVGLVGAKIIVVLLLFVTLMILTGTTLIQLFKTFKKPVDAVSGGIQTAKQHREEKLQRQFDSSIDISLDDGMPEHPVKSDVANLFPKASSKRQKTKPAKSEKLDKLKEAFGISDADEPEKPQPLFDEITEKSDDVFQLKPNTDTTSPTGTEESAAQIETASVSETPLDRHDVTDASDVQDEKAVGDFSDMERYANEKDSPGTYFMPPVTLLESSKASSPQVDTEELQSNGNKLVETLKSFGVQTKILDISRGPTVTRYELQPAAGVKISKITNLADDIAMNLAASGVRIEAPIPGKAAVGIEVPNKAKTIVHMREIIESNKFATAKSKLTFALGRDISGEITVADLAKMPHMLIAGTTGSGKSVCVNSLVVSMLYKATPDEVRFLMIDPKVVELVMYNGIPHLLVPVVTDPHKAAGALNWAVTEMLNRYKIFADCNVKELARYNTFVETMGYMDENGQPMPKMPQIVIIIDELADLMMISPHEVEDAICRIAQMGRAAGMHLVVATQRPSVDVVTGLIKANIPSRIAFAVKSMVDSRTILDIGGAEKLLGYGDMLFSPIGATKPVRIQGCYVDETEIDSIVEFVKKSRSIEYDEKVIEEIEKNAAADNKREDEADSSSSPSDPMMDEAIKCVVDAGQASTSLLQRRLRLGYARAGRLIDEMEQMGIVGPHEGSKPRQVLMSYTQWLERNMNKQSAALPELPEQEDIFL